MTGVIIIGTFGAAPASANQKHQHAVDIKSLASAPVDGAVCPGAVLPPDFPPTANLMTGTLDGCWYTDTGDPSTPPIDNGDGTFTQSFVGTEHFVGCLHTRGNSQHKHHCDKNDPSGTWTTTYLFTATFSSATGAELFGACFHPIVVGSGTGDFNGVMGTIFMTDNVQNGTANVTGTVLLPS